MVRAQDLVTIHVNIPLMHYTRADTFFTLARFKSCLFFKFLLIYSKSCLVRLPRPYTSCEGAVAVFVRNSPEWRTPCTQSERNSATYEKTEVRNSRGVSFEVRKIPLRFRLPFFIGGAVTLSPWSSILRRISDKNDHCASTRGSRGEVMIFFEKNKVLGVEPNRVLNILEGIQKINTT